MVAPHADALIGHVRANRERYLDELKAWIAVPSISAQPDHAPEVRRSAEFAAERMRQAGLTEVAVLETGKGGHPVAYGAWLGAKGKPTILIYGHHDVQPVDPLELWTTPPFAGDVRDGKIYGRGSVDDKGQCLMHLAAIEAHLSVNGKLPLNVRSSSKARKRSAPEHFEAFLAREKKRLACDVVVVSDTAVFAEDVPSLTTSLRGLVHWEITVHGPSSDLHSGYYGGVVKNPLEALAQILTALKDTHGRVVVPGFYDGVRELSPRERAEIAALPLDPAQARERARRHGAGRRDRAAPARADVVPADDRGQRDVRRLSRCRREDDRAVVCDGESLGAAGAASGSRAGEARGRRTFVQRIAPRGVRVEIEATVTCAPVGPRAIIRRSLAAARAMELGFGKAPVFIGTGGTIGPVSSFDRILRLPQVLIGVGLPDDAIHAPNEKFDLGQFYGGIETMAYLYDELARALK